MILEAIKDSTKTLIFKPFILIPMIIISIVSYLLIEATSGLLENYLNDIFLYGETLMEIDPFSYILGTYPGEVILLLLAGIVMLFASAIAFISIAKFCNKKSFAESINSSIMEWKRTIGFVIFWIIVGFLFFAIWFGIVSVLDWINNATGGALSILINALFIIVSIILAVIFTIKLAFVLPAFAEGENLRNAIQKSWDVTKNSFWNALAFIVIILVIVYLINYIFLELSLIFVDIEVLLLSIGEIISTTFFALGISYYYYKR